MTLLVGTVTLLYVLIAKIVDEGPASPTIYEPQAYLYGMSAACLASYRYPGEKDWDELSRITGIPVIVLLRLLLLTLFALLVIHLGVGFVAIVFRVVLISLIILLAAR